MDKCKLRDNEYDTIVWVKQSDMAVKPFKFIHNTFSNTLCFCQRPTTFPRWSDCLNIETIKLHQGAFAEEEPAGPVFTSLSLFQAVISEPSIKQIVCIPYNRRTRGLILGSRLHRSDCFEQSGKPESTWTWYRVQWLYCNSVALNRC